MAGTKTKILIVAGVGAVVLAAAFAVRSLYNYLHYYPWQVRYANNKTLEQVPPQVKIVPARFSANGGWGIRNGKILGIGQPIDILLQIAYQIHKDRIVFSTEMPSRNYDFIASLPGDNIEALRKEVEKTFNLTVKTEKRETDVMLLTLKRRNVPGLKHSGSSSPPSSSEWMGDKYVCVNVPLSTLTAFLEQRFNIPVVDQTGLTGQFDIDINWRHSYPDTLKQALINDLGLELLPGRKPIEILVVNITD